MTRLRLAAVLTMVTACGRTEPLRDPFAPGATGATGATGASGAPFDAEGTAPGGPGASSPVPDRCAQNSTETHRLDPMTRRPIDVLFVVDDSGSMAGDQRKLGENFGAFISSFTSNQVDFQIGAVTTDMRAARRSGRLVAPFLTSSTPDVQAAFLGMVTVGSSGSSTEMGLGAAQAALTDPLASHENKGLVRSDADFALVFLGDEDDQSSVVIPAFAQSLRALKGSNGVTVASIIGLGDCLLPGLVARWRLADFAREFGRSGVLAVCTDDYADVLRTIAGRVVNSRCIVGLKRPIDDRSRVRVSVNGADATWRATAPDTAYPNGSLEVEPCPEGGGRIDISYDDCWH